jgi:hypothetical protein
MVAAHPHNPIAADKVVALATTKSAATASGAVVEH